MELKPLADQSHQATMVRNTWLAATHSQARVDLGDISPCSPSPHPIRDANAGHAD